MTESSTINRQYQAADMLPLGTSLPTLLHTLSNCGLRIVGKFGDRVRCLGVPLIPLQGNKGCCGYEANAGVNGETLLVYNDALYEAFRGALLGQGTGVISDGSR